VKTQRTKLPGLALVWLVACGAPAGTTKPADPDAASDVVAVPLDGTTVEETGADGGVTGPEIAPGSDIAHEGMDDADIAMTPEVAPDVDSGAGTTDVPGAPDADAAAPPQDVDAAQPDVAAADGADSVTADDIVPDTTDTGGSDVPTDVAIDAPDAGDGATDATPPFDGAAADGSDAAGPDDATVDGSDDVLGAECGDGLCQPGEDTATCAVDCPMPCSPQCNGVSCDDGCGGTCAGQVCVDGNPCTTSDSCAAGSCIGTPVACDDANSCTADACDTANGTCAHAPDDGATATGLACEPTPCLSVQAKCSGGQATCSGLADSGQNGAACGSNGACAGGICLPIVCTPTSADCDGNTARKCVSSGLTWALAPCGTGATCVTGSCKAHVCTPDSVTCQGNVLVACDAVGLALTVSEDCGTNGQVCANGGCVSPICQPGATQCQSSNLLQCAANGLGWTTLSCGNGFTCQTGECTSQICAPGIFSCNLKQVVQCANSGMAYDVVTDCSLSGQTCVNSACTTPICTDADNTCSGTTAKRCKPDGSGFVATICTTPDVCHNGTCIAPTCTPNAKACQGSTVVTCDGLGLSSAATPDCSAAGQVCLGGACVNPLCIPGAHKCSAGVGYVCDGTGTAWLATPCAAGALCLGDICGTGVCVPNTTFCQGTFVAQCDATGQDAALVKNCLNDGMYCSDGQCAIAACVPGKKTCQAGDVAVCKNDGSGWQVFQDCADADPCTWENCDPTTAACVYPKLPCDDGNSCTVDACVAGICIGAAGPVATCDDGNPCTTADFCGNGSCGGTRVGRVVTVAGDGSAGMINGNAATARFSGLGGLARMSDGSILIADGNNHLIRRWLPGVGVGTFAGTGFSGSTDGAALSAKFAAPAGIAIGPDGVVYVSDNGNHTIRKISNGQVTTLVPASAGFYNVGQLAFAPDGRLVVANGAFAYHAVDATGAITAYFVPGTGLSLPDVGPTSGVSYNAFGGFGWDPQGDFYFAGSKAGTWNIYRVSPSHMVSLAIAKSGNHLAVTADGHIWMNYGYGFKRLDAAGNGSGVCGSLTTSGWIDGDYLTARFGQTLGDPLLLPDGSLLLSDVTNNVIRQVTPLGLGCDDGNTCTADLCLADGTCTHTPLPDASPCDDGNACTGVATCSSGACKSGPVALCADGNGCTDDGCDPWTGACEFTANTALCNAGSACNLNMRCTNSSCNEQPITATFIAGGGYGGVGYVNAVGANAKFGLVLGQIAPATDGGIFIADPEYNTIRHVTADGTVSGYGGTGAGFLPGNLGQGRTGPLVGLVADRHGNLIFSTGHQLGRIFSGQVESWCGGATSGFADGDCATALFSSPKALAIDALGTVYVADSGNNSIRAISPAGVVTTVAGTGALGALDGPAGSATFNQPTGIAFGPTGTLYVADRGNNVVRAISAGNVTTFAGGGTVKTSPVSVQLMQFGTDGVRWVSVISDGSVVATDNYNVWRIKDGIAMHDTSFWSAGATLPMPDGSFYLAGQSVINRLNAQVKGCDDASPCTIDSCDPASGACIFAPLPAQSPCDDGDACSSGDACNAAAQCVGQIAVCNDGNPCTVDGCEPYLGTCHFVVRTGACDDGAACNTADACLNGVCQSDVPMLYFLSGSLNGDKAVIDGPGVTARFYQPTSPCADAAGNVYFADLKGTAFFVRRIAPDGTMTTFDFPNAPSVVAVACSNLGLAAIRYGGEVYMADSQGKYTVGVLSTAFGATFGNVDSWVGLDDGTLLYSLYQSGDYVDPNLAWIYRITSAGKATAIGNFTSKFPVDDGIIRVSSAGALPGYALSQKGEVYRINSASLTYIATLPSTSRIAVTPSGKIFQMVNGHLTLFNPATKSSTTLGGGGTVLGDTPLANADLSTCDVFGQATDSRVTLKCNTAFLVVRLPSNLCNDGNPCTDEACVGAAGGCVFTTNTAPCADDANPCTADACVNGSCVHTPIAGNCGSDGNGCTDDVCTAGVCTHLNNTAACTDGNTCTAMDACTGGKCVGQEVLCSPLQTCVNGTGCTSLFPGTQILTGNAQLQLNTWTSLGHVWNVCYAANGNAGSGSALANACQGKGPAITVISAQGQTFGAYQALKWQISNDPLVQYGYQDPDAFVFSIDNLTKMPIYSPGLHAFWAFWAGDTKTPGPKFGDGDIAIDANLAAGTSSLGMTYNVGGINCGGPCSAYLAGSSTFNLTRIEVYTW
jgi:sugar lactone lactonase YvrE